MIGSGLKKLAANNGLKVARGIAYGSLRGYAATLCEGSGTKQIVITTRFQEPQQQDSLRQVLNARNLSSEFRVRELTFVVDGICVVFQDNPGTMKRIEAFIDWFMPLLSQYGASPAEVCAECGQPIADAGTWVLQGNSAAFHMHTACAQRAARKAAEENQQRQEADQGSYVQGALGALGGALLGSVLWALIWVAGYVASVVGLAIGWLAEKGYTLLNGKVGKGKLAVLIVVTILAVVLGTLAGLVADVYIALSDNGISTSIQDCISLVFEVVLVDEKAAGEVAVNLLMGIAFAALGVFGILRKTKEEIDGEVVTVLE